MDHDQLIDDLFGDGDAVQLQTAPLIDGLSQRIDELSSSSCCQRIAFSKEPSVASIAPDSKSVKIYVFNRNPKNAKWRINKSFVAMPDVGDADIVHVVWSALGTDLAIIDSLGRIFLYKTSNCLGRIRLQRQGANDTVNDFDPVIGFQWLDIAPHNKMSGICWSASRSSSNWNYEIKYHLPPHGPCNPVQGLNSFLVVTRGGQIKLFYATMDGQWLEKSTWLEGFPRIANTITHASFAKHPEQITFLATYDLTKRLKVYKIQINWNYDEVVAPNKAPAPPNPSIEALPQVLEALCEPMPPNQGDHENSVMTGLDLTNFYQLTHLEFAPLIPDKSLGEQFPTVLATFLSIPSASTVGLDPVLRYQGASSVVCRWNLKIRQANPIMSIMEELNLPKMMKDNRAIRITDIPPRRELHLERLSDVYLHSIVLSQQVVRQNTLVAFYLNDGSIQFRFRDSMELASADGNYEEVRTLPQAGFSFPQHEPALHVSLSPSYCCAVTMDNEGEVKLRKMEYSVDNLNALKEDQPQFGAIAALFALCTISGYQSYSTVDDLIAIIPADVNESLANAISEQLLLATYSMGGVLDYSSADANTVMTWLSKNQTSQRCLSFHYAISPLSKAGLRPNALLAWSLFNLRLIGTTVYQCIKPDNRWRPELAHSLMPINRYAWTLIGWMIQSIADMVYDLKDTTKDFETINNYIQKERTPALHILLCSLPRRVLRITLQLLSKQIEGARARITALQQDLEAHPENMAQIRQWQSFLSTIGKQCPVFALAIQEKAPLDALINGIDHAVQNIYNKTPRFANDNKEEKQKSEVHMFVTCTVPAHLLTVALAIMDGVDQAGKQGKYDRGVLYRYDKSWIGMPGYEDISARKKVYDVVKKTEVVGKTKLKKCPRCASVMEDPEFVKGPLWVSGVMNNCICSARWSVWGDGEVEKVKSEDRMVDVKTEAMI